MIKIKCNHCGRDFFITDYEAIRCIWCKHDQLASNEEKQAAKSYFAKYPMKK